MATVTSCGNLCTLQLFKLNQSAFLTDGEKKTFFEGRQLTLRFDDLWRLTVITPLRGDAPYTKSILCTIVSFFYVKFIWYCVRARNHCCVLWDVTRDCAPAPLRSLRIRTRVHFRGRRGRGKGEKKVCSLSLLPFPSLFPPFLRKDVWFSGYTIIFNLADPNIHNLQSKTANYEKTCIQLSLYSVVFTASLQLSILGVYWSDFNVSNNQSIA